MFERIAGNRGRSRGWRTRKSYAGRATSRMPAGRRRGRRVCDNRHNRRPLKALQVGDGSLGFAIGRVDIGIRPVLGTVIGGIGHSWPVLVRPRPGSGTGAVVSSANSLGNALSLMKRRSCSGRWCQAARPTISRSIGRSRFTPATGHPFGVRRVNPPRHFPDFPPDGFRSRTPGPPPFSSMKSTPAASGARRPAARRLKACLTDLL
jgi:hypothetical protein